MRPFSLARTDAVLKDHPRYIKAKAGCAEAAVEVVADIALRFIARISAQLPPHAWYVAPHAKEATGDNAIPQVLASACASAARALVDTDIVQTSRVFHTGADPMERMATRPDFEGIVVPGADYVLVDDVTTMGGTLAELGNYIQQRDGNVVGAVVLVNAGRIEEFHPSQSVLSELAFRYETQIEQIFGISINALTGNEANYLIGFRTAVEIRNRLAKARKEGNLRLRSKGIEG